MKIRTKLLLLVIVPIFAICIEGVLQCKNSYNKMTQGQLLLQSSEIAGQISNLVHELQKERGRTAGFLGSQGKKFSSELQTQRKSTDEKFATLTTALKSYPKDKVSKRIQNRLDIAIRNSEQLAQVRNQVSAQNINAPTAIGYYTDLNSDMLSIVQSMSDQSTNARITSELAANLYLQKTKENAGIERAILSNAFAADAFSPDLFQKFIGNLAKQQTYMNEFENLATEKMSQIYHKASADSSFAKVEEYRKLAMNKANDGGFGVAPSDWFSTITTKINQLKSAEEQVSQYVAHDIHESNEAYKQEMYHAGFIAGGFALLTICIGIWSYHSINRPIQAMTDRMKDIAQGEGDLTQRVDDRRKDELGIMAGFFNQFVEKIQQTVIHVAQATRDVASAATEIAATSEQMAGSLSHQKTQNHQVASAVEELSCSVMEIANRTTTLSNHATSSGDTAKEGNQVVDDTVQKIQLIANIVNEASSQMHELGERSQSIGVVIRVINDIAEQTNLLALNAAIEAARAGQHGRGFAVVADEVRKLAERTTSATDEVTQLITAIQTQTQSAIEHMGQGTSLVDEGVNAASSAGEALSRIVDGTQEVGTLVASIAAATEQQSSATQEISRSLESISSASEESNQAAGQAADAAGQLSRRAESLQTMINQFKV
tara:strand:+ start:50612 stop:52591 length:1980 start_codon:yes stop_codon:yes gene_type:complete